MSTHQQVPHQRSTRSRTQALDLGALLSGESAGSISYGCGLAIAVRALHHARRLETDPLRQDALAEAVARSLIGRAAAYR